MPSDMREAVAGAIGGQIGVHDCTDLAADAALAVIRERLAEKVPELPSDGSPESAERAGWANATRAAMLRELGGEG